MNKKKIERKYSLKDSDFESMLNELKNFILNSIRYESVKWALDSVDVIDSYEVSIRFLFEIALTIEQPRYKDMALGKILHLFDYEDLEKEYLKELIYPLKNDLIKNTDEWVSLKALQIYDKLITDVELIKLKTFELIKKKNISDKVKEKVFWLIKNKEISLEDIEKAFVTTNDYSAKFWFAFLLYSKGKVDFREYLEKVGNKDELNDEQIRFWNNQATQYSFPEIDIPRQDEENQNLQLDDMTDIVSDIFNKESVFLAFAEEDKKIVEEIYSNLKAVNLNPWMYTKDSIAGENWRENLPEIIKKSKFAIICLSTHSIEKRGFVQREIKFILEEQEMKPQGTIYAIPLRINNCKVPNILVGNTKLTDLTWIEYFEKGFNKIISSMLYELRKY